MTLDELAAAGAPPPEPGVPGWLRGAWRRRSIIFHTAATDPPADVLWLQSRGLTADIRLPVERPDPGGIADLIDAPPEVLLFYADVDGWASPTRYDGALMHWLASEGLQVHDRFPEPARLDRIGDCMIEIAPSGAYVEDWRLEPSADGPLVGLRLIEERDLDAGTIRHRGGALVVCGDHAMLVRGRPAPLPHAGTLAAFVRANLGNRAALAAAFAAEASYARRQPDGGFAIALSTNPLRVGRPLLATDGFVREADGTLTQRAVENGRRIERRFVVDTLETASFPLATPATAQGIAWLQG